MCVCVCVERQRNRQMRGRKACLIPPSVGGRAEAGTAYQQSVQRRDGAESRRKESRMVRLGKPVNWTLLAPSMYEKKVTFQSGKRLMCWLLYFLLKVIFLNAASFTEPSLSSSKIESLMPPRLRVLDLGLPYGTYQFPLQMTVIYKVTPCPDTFGWSLVPLMPNTFFTLLQPAFCSRTPSCVQNTNRHPLSLASDGPWGTFTVGGRQVGLFSPLVFSCHLRMATSLNWKSLLSEWLTLGDSTPFQVPVFTL